MILYKATIPLVPVSKKNSQRILYNAKRDVHFIAPSLAYERYERDALRLLPAVIRDRRMAISGPVNVKCLFYMPTRRRVDLTNLLEAIDDVLVKGCIIRDDSSDVIASHDGSRVLYDRKCPRTEIVIEEALT